MASPGALNAAASSGKIAGARQAGGAQAPSAAGQKGQQGQQGTGSFASQLQAAGVGGRHLLQAPKCLFSGQVGGTGIFVSGFDVRDDLSALHERA